VDASGRKALAESAPASVARPTAARPAIARATAPVVIAAAVGDGQAGYIHFFVITTPDGDSETQIGIELADRTIAWSFPGLGVVASPFIESGIVEANGTRYEVRHLYGIRPFPDDQSMRTLQTELPRRIAPYVDDETPYCYLRSRGDPFCLSCFDFVARVVFPGHFPAPPALPRDFERTTSSPNYTTEDLLLYLLGLHALPTQAARLKRVSELALPAHLREEVARLVELMGPDDSVVTADAARAPGAAAKSRRSAQPSGTIAQQRPAWRRRS
jgi:hypothetical protein